ncbi:uncharacterized protein ACNLHF_013939 [Anomaloglossus baeobatrachus]|uniref:uncharacterized protein LOC142297198 n=1 Tax=Anomaloglossus baeobatrachus TaxID=238106 RepID=UPI003F4FC51E
MTEDKAAKKSDKCDKSEKSEKSDNPDRYERTEKIKKCPVFWPWFIMDFRTRDQTWLLELDRAFKDGSNTTPEGVDDGIKERIFKYKGILRKRTRMWWNKSFLEKYLEKDLIPRGLRIQIFPSYGVEDPEFKKEWELLSGTCSRGYMKLLIKSNIQSLKEYEQEMEELQASISRELPHESFSALEDELKQLVEKWDKEVRDLKFKKLQRDLGDFNNNRMYRWKSAGGRSRPPFRSGSASRSRSTSLQSGISDIESIGETANLAGTSETYTINTRGRNRLNPPLKNQTKGKPAKKSNALEVINLSSHKLTQYQLEVLSRGLNFVPTNCFNLFTAVKDLHLFARKLILKKLHHRSHGGDGLDSTLEREALQVLNDLLEEQNVQTQGSFSSFHLSIYAVFRTSFNSVTKNCKFVLMENFPPSLRL